MILLFLLLVCLAIVFGARATAMMVLWLVGIVFVVLVVAVLSLSHG